MNATSARVPAVATRVSDRGVAFGLFLIALIVYVWLPINQTLGDPLWNLPVAFSIVHQGNIELDEYARLRDQLGWPYNYTTIEIDGRIYNRYPLGASLFAVPFVLVVEPVANLLGSVNLYERSQLIVLPGFDQFIGAASVAATVAVFFLAARQTLLLRRALMLALLFALGTSALSTASRALWQHGPSMLTLMVTLYALLRARVSVNYLALAGAALALAYIVRPTNSVAVAVISLLVVWQYRRDALRFFVGAALVALPFFAFSLGVFGRVLPPYYRGHYILALDIQAVLEALAGLLVSPNRGLFTFSPFLLFGLVGLGLKLRDRSLSLLDAALFVIVGLHWLVMGAYINWYAGHSFGPRYMSDVLPFLMFFLIPFVAALPRMTMFWRRAAVTLFGLTAILSIGIHWRGATDHAVHDWNVTPFNIDDVQDRVWDWGDLQFLRGLLPVAEVSQDERPLVARVDFDATSLEYLNEGWGEPELEIDGDTVLWTHAERASLALVLPTADDLAIEVKVERGSTNANFERYQLLVNGHEIMLDFMGKYRRGVIPAEVLQASDGPVEFVFVIPEPTLPRVPVDDARRYGIRVDHIELRVAG